MFGDNNYTEWADVFRLYRPPPYEIPGLFGVYSFGIAGNTILHYVLAATLFVTVLKNFFSVIQLKGLVFLFIFMVQALQKSFTAEK